MTRVLRHLTPSTHRWVVWPIARLVRIVFHSRSEAASVSGRRGKAGRRAAAPRWRRGASDSVEAAASGGRPPPRTVRQIVRSRGGWRAVSRGRWGRTGCGRRGRIESGAPSRHVKCSVDLCTSTATWLVGGRCKVCRYERPGSGRLRGMRESLGLSHVAMSVPQGTLTDEYRTRLLEFYGRMLDWREIESLRRPDRLTIAVGATSYINVREQPEPMECHGYDHFGVLLRSAADLNQLWADLAADPLDVELEELSTTADGEGSFRFRHLLPMAVEAQYYSDLVNSLAAAP